MKKQILSSCFGLKGEHGWTVKTGASRFKAEGKMSPGESLLQGVFILSRSGGFPRPEIRSKKTWHNVSEIYKEGSGNMKESRIGRRGRIDPRVSCGKKDQSFVRGQS